MLTIFQTNVHNNFFVIIIYENYFKYLCMSIGESSFSVICIPSCVLILVDLLVVFIQYIIGCLDILVSYIHVHVFMFTDIELV